MFVLCCRLPLLTRAGFQVNTASVNHRTRGERRVRAKHEPLSLHKHKDVCFVCCDTPLECDYTFLNVIVVVCTCIWTEEYKMIKLAPNTCVLSLPFLLSWRLLVSLDAHWLRCSLVMRAVLSGVFFLGLCASFIWQANQVISWINMFMIDLKMSDEAPGRHLGTVSSTFLLPLNNQALLSSFGAVKHIQVTSQVFPGCEIPRICSVFLLLMLFVRSVV